MYRVLFIIITLSSLFVPSAYSSVCYQGTDTSSFPSGNGNYIYAGRWFKVNGPIYEGPYDARSVDADGWKWYGGHLNYITGAGTDAEGHGGSGHSIQYDIISILDSSSVPDCEPTEPAHCSNNVKDGDEIGINCGGSCSAECSHSCDYGVYDEAQDKCLSTTSPDKFGNCPEFAGFHKDSNGECTHSSDPVLADPDFNNPDPGADAPQLPTGGSFSTVTDHSSTTVDNGDGTTTTTDIDKQTGSDGRSKTTTKTTLKDKATGKVLGSSTKVDIETPKEDNPDNYEYGTRLDEVDNTIDSNGEIYAQFSGRFATFQATVSQSQIMKFMNSLFDFSGHDGSAVSTVDLGEWGSAQVDYSAYENILNTIGYALIMCSFLVSYRLIVANK